MAPSRFPPARACSQHAIILGYGHKCSRHTSAELDLYLSFLFLQVALQQAALRDAFQFSAYEGLQTAKRLKEQYLLIPAKTKEVYLAHLLSPEQVRPYRCRLVQAGEEQGQILLHALHT